MDRTIDKDRLKSAGLLVLTGGFLLAIIGLSSHQPAAARPAQQVTRTATATRTRTPTPTRTRTPTVTPTRTLQPPNLIGQVVFGFGAQVLDACLSPQDPDTPSVIYTRAGMLGRLDQLCLIGFPQHEQVQIKIFDPAGQLALSVPYTIQNQEAAQSEAFNLSTVSLPPLPFAAPVGRWTIQVARPRGVVKGSFEVEHSPWDYSFGRPVPAGAPWYDPRRSGNLSAGETLLVEGEIDRVNQQVPLALFRVDRPMTLAAAQNVLTDRNGGFSAGFAIDSQFTPGRYYVKLAPVPESQNLGLSVPKYYFNVIQPTPACQGAQPARLQNDQSAFVSAGQKLDVREKPGLGNRSIGKLFEYEALQVLKGPLCADGMVWWKVSSLNTGMDGWAPEGQGGDYWIISIGE